jgi:D-alanyl-D-alanine carboxypeptidase/D-alanyl-D-alanine-endopeptidase (penicillin-binding protein 4)
MKALAAAGIAVDRGWDVRWEVGESIGRSDGHPSRASCLVGAVDQCPGAWRVASLESPPLGELVDVALGPSQNWVAEQLTMALGAQLGERGSLREGLDVVERFLIDDVGIAALEVAARDGSGLSAYNLVTPRAIARVLRHMAARPDAGAYRAAMAEPREEESTLEERLLGLEGRVFAKTGTISNVNSLSGFLVRDDGREVIFVILSNGAGLDGDTMRSTIDDVVRVLAR